MTPELTALALVGLLHFVQFTLASVMANRDVGAGYTTSSRDRMPSREMREVTARMLRAYDNHAVMFPFFAAGCLIVTFADKSGLFSLLAAFGYLAFRVLYVPAYAFGWRPWRSLLWIGAAAMCFILFLVALI